MYDELFKRNKKALAFLKEKEGLTDAQLGSITPIRHTKLNVKTLVGIADLLTEFAEKIIESDYIEIDANIDEAYYHDGNKQWLISGSADVLIKKEDLEKIKH